MRQRLILCLAALSLIPSLARATAGRARVRLTRETVVLANDTLEIAWHTGTTGLRLQRIEDKLAQTTFETAGEVFVLTLANGRDITASAFPIADRRSPHDRETGWNRGWMANHPITERRRRKPARPVASRPT